MLPGNSPRATATKLVVPALVDPHDLLAEVLAVQQPQKSFPSCGEEVSLPSSGSIAPAFRHLRIDSLPHSATHIGSAQSGMVQWGFVITIKRRLAIAPTLSVLSFASIGRL